MYIITRATVAAEHKKLAFCYCGSPTALRFSDEYFVRSGTDRQTGQKVRTIEAVCSAHPDHRPTFLGGHDGWGALDALDGYPKLFVPKPGVAARVKKAIGRS